MVSALVPYKRIDVAIDAAGRLGVPLQDRRHRPRSRRGCGPLAGPTVEFLGSVDDAALRDAVPARARALVLPGEEDFGIAPVEALACGRPVVALGRGGALRDRRRTGVTGLLVDDADARGVRRRDGRGDRGARSTRRRLRAHAEPFGVERFEAAFRGVLVGDAARPRPMLRRYNRLLVAIYVVADFAVAASRRSSSPISSGSTAG